MSSEALEDRIGTLAETYSQFQHRTWQEAAEITNARRKLKDGMKRRELRDKCFLTANFAMYTLEGCEEFLYFGGREDNPIFRNTRNAKDAVKHLYWEYWPNDEDIKAVMECKSTLKVKLSDLGLKRAGKEGYFEIDTSNNGVPVKRGGLNKARRALAERIYGQRDDFEKNMKMFSDAGINTLMIRVLNSRYVREYAQNYPIILACWLGNFSSFHSMFDASYKEVYNNCWLRGVLKVA